MTKNEFERLRIFLKRYPGNRISFEHVYVYLHCTEADQAQQIRPTAKRGTVPTDFEIRKNLGKLSVSLDYRTLKVDLDSDVVIGRPHSYGDKKVKPVRIPRKEIKKINLGISYYPRGNEGSLSDGFNVRF